MREIYLTEPHECDVLRFQKGTNLQVSKIMGKWYFVPNGKDAYGIRNCPYCGKHLIPDKE